MAQNILLLSPRRRVYFARCLRAAIHRLSPMSKIYVADADINDPVRFVLDGFFRLSSPNLADEVLNICLDQGIKSIVAWNDVEIGRLASARNRFEEAGVTLCIPPDHFVELCNDKLLTFRWCGLNDVPTPRVYSPDEFCLVRTWPLVVKPRYGQGSVEVQHVHGIEHLRSQPKWTNQNLYLVQEFIAGTEYTVDVGMANGVILYIVPRIRTKVRDAESYVSQVDLNKNVLRSVTHFLSFFRITGLINIQVINSQDATWLLEINPRLASGVDLAAAAGALVHEYLADWCLGGCMRFRFDQPISNGLMMSRYPEAIFFESPAS